MDGKNDVLITDIIKKVREELKNLEIEKNLVMTSLKDVGGQIRTIDKKEMQLRAKIESLVKKEADMSKRKVKLEKRLESIRKKLSKLSDAQKSISQAF